MIYESIEGVGMRILIFMLALSLSPMGLPRGHALPADEPIQKPKNTSSKAASMPSVPVNVQESGLASAPPHRLKFPLIIDFRYGLPLESQNPEVRSHWEHDVWNSYLTAVGLYWESPHLFNGSWWLFVGPEFLYQHSHEVLSSSNGMAALDTETLGLQLNTGLTWQPQSFGGDIGMQLVVGLPVWAQRSASIDADGFKKDLGTQATQPIGVALNVFYEIGKQWRPFIGYEGHLAPHIDLGLNYAF
jgi:hypothetical protein